MVYEPSETFMQEIGVCNAAQMFNLPSVSAILTSPHLGHVLLERTDAAKSQNIFNVGIK